jgi:hypothetical protein
MDRRYKLDLDVRINELAARRKMLERQYDDRVHTITELGNIRQESLQRLCSAFEAQNAQAKLRNTALLNDVQMFSCRTPLKELTNGRNSGDSNNRIKDAKEMYLKTLENAMPVWHRQQTIRMEEKVREIQLEKAMSIKRRETLKKELIRENEVKQELERHRQELLYALATEQRNILEAKANAILLEEESRATDKNVINQISTASSQLQDIVASNIHRMHEATRVFMREVSPDLPDYYKVAVPREYSCQTHEDEHVDGQRERRGHRPHGHTGTGPGGPPFSSTSTSSSAAPTAAASSSPARSSYQHKADVQNTEGEYSQQQQQQQNADRLLGGVQIQLRRPSYASSFAVSNNDSGGGDVSGAIIGAEVRSRDGDYSSDQDAPHDRDHSHSHTESGQKPGRRQSHHEEDDRHLAPAVATSFNLPRSRSTSLASPPGYAAAPGATSPGKFSNRGGFEEVGADGPGTATGFDGGMHTIPESHVESSTGRGVDYDYNYGDRPFPDTGNSFGSSRGEYSSSSSSNGGGAVSGGELRASDQQRTPAVASSDYVSTGGRGADGNESKSMGMTIDILSPPHSPTAAAAARTNPEGRGGERGATPSASPRHSSSPAAAAAPAEASLLRQDANTSSISHKDESLSHGKEDLDVNLTTASYKSEGNSTTASSKRNIYEIVNNLSATQCASILEVLSKTVERRAAESATSRANSGVEKIYEAQSRHRAVHIFDAFVEGNYNAYDSDLFSVIDNAADSTVGSAVLAIVQGKAEILIPRYVFCFAFVSFGIALLILLVLFLTSDSFSGVMTIDKLKKEYKRIAVPGTVQLWDRMVNHLQKLVELNYNNLSFLSM